METQLNMKSDPLITDAGLIAREMYAIANIIENDFEDEKWRTVIKLKNAASDAYFNVANVVGAGKNQSLEYDCINARKNLIALKSMYIFASKEGMIKLDPQLVVDIDNLVGKIDQEMTASRDEIKLRAEEELKPWLEKYHIWQKISKNQ